MACSGANSYRVDLVCQDTPTNKLEGYVMDDYDNICGYVCAYLDGSNVVKVNFSNYLCLTPIAYSVCRDTTPNPDEFYVCLPGTSTDPDCCPDCPDCQNDSESTDRSCTLTLSNASDPNNADIEGDYELAWNATSEYWEFYETGLTAPPYDQISFQLYMCSDTVAPENKTGDDQVLLVDIDTGDGFVSDQINITDAGCSKGPHGDSGTYFEYDWEFSD